MRGWCYVRLAALCARLNAVLSALCLRLSFAQYFVIHSETRMYFFAVQIAACCWHVAVTAQMMNVADAAALKQTLTDLGCWQSSACQTWNFSCSSNDVVRCNANGLVTHL